MFKFDFSKIILKDLLLKCKVPFSDGLINEPLSVVVVVMFFLEIIEAEH